MISIELVDPSVSIHNFPFSGLVEGQEILALFLLHEHLVQYIHHGSEHLIVHFNSKVVILVQATAHLWFQKVHIQILIENKVRSIESNTILFSHLLGCETPTLEGRHSFSNSLLELTADMRYGIRNSQLGITIMLTHVLLEFIEGRLAFFCQFCVRRQVLASIGKVGFVVGRIANTGIAIVIEHQEGVNRGHHPKHAHIVLAAIPREFVADITLNDKF